MPLPRPPVAEKRGPARMEDSVAGLRATLAALDAAANGTFLNYDGTPIPW